MIIQERFTRCALENCNSDFWEEVKGIKNSKKGVSGIVDDLCDTSEIANIFAGSYEDLYMSVPYNSDEMEAINAEVNSCLDGFTSDCVVSFSNVVEAVNCLKFGKMTGILVCLLIMLNMVLVNYLYIYLCFFHPCLFTVWFQLIS